MCLWFDSLFEVPMVLCCCVAVSPEGRELAAIGNPALWPTETVMNVRTAVMLKSRYTMWAGFVFGFHVLWCTHSTLIYFGIIYWKKQITYFFSSHLQWCLSLSCHRKGRTHWRVRTWVGISEFPQLQISYPSFFLTCTRSLELLTLPSTQIHWPIKTIARIDLSKYRCRIPSIQNSTVTVFGYLESLALPIPACRSHYLELCPRAI